jgi:NhaC family Na+:H+ antiporter
LDKKIISGRKPSLVVSLIPVIFLIATLTITVIIFGDKATSGPVQSVLMLAAAFAAVFALTHGIKWHDLEEHVLGTMADVMQPILILLLIGALIGVWILSGIVPAIIVWGLKLLSPSIFLFTACIISSVVSMATGSSWSTAGTIGVALVGIGQAMDMNLGMTAGAIVSGAYFGDKLSPFSETTNLAASMAETPLFVHIRHMIWTTTPALIIALILYLILGFTQSHASYTPEKIKIITDIINSKFDTSVYMLLPPVITIGIMVKRFPAIPSIIIGIALGIIFALIFQPQVVSEMAGKSDLPIGMASLKTCLDTAATGFRSSTGMEIVDNLLNKGGMAAMLNTIWLILSAMFFAGVMDGSGMMGSIADGILKGIRGSGNLVAATLGTAVLVNILAAEQYLSIVITGRMYKEAYDKQGLHRKNLSRALEDAGTLTSPLVPWNTCGAFMATTLGVATYLYLPFAFLNIITPLVSLVYAYTGFTIEHVKKAGE